MATSGTTAFDLSIDDIVEEAYERCGLSTNSGYDLKKARRGLNVLFSEWGNRGVHLWKVEKQTQALTAGTATYTTPTSTNDVLEAYISTASAPGTNVTDVTLSKIDRSTYAALPNKGSTGQPSQYFVQRFIDKVTITLYLTPGDTQAGDFIYFYYVKRIQDAGKYTNEADVVNRFVPCMCAGLAYYMAMKKAPQRVQEMKLIYEDELQRALQEDGSAASVYISPKTYYPEI